ncbi:MAG TPA: ABC transporter permease [Candidatus Saccharimonadales bacterium]|nr:ABC transporter permease [Candidatus Saccharimonadales bacterium]
MGARSPTARAVSAIALRLGLILLTFILVVVLAQIALVSARTRIDHSDLGTILQQAAEGTQDYFGSLLAGSLGEATTTSILGGQRRSMGQVLLDTYPKSMVLVLIAVGSAALLGIAAGIAAAAVRTARARGALLGVTILAISTPSFLLAVGMVMLSGEMTSRYGIRLWPSFGFGWDDHLIVPSIVLGARPFAQIANITYVSIAEILLLDYIRTARSKGLVESLILSRHALGNAAVPIIGAVATGLGIALSTLPVVEVFFSWPGLGAMLLQSIRRFDAATAGTLLGTLAVTIALARFALDAVASRYAARAA